MNDIEAHNRLVAKIQHFSDYLKQIQLEKEALLIALNDNETMETELKNEIDICREILNDYYKIFDDILYR